MLNFGASLELGFLELELPPSLADRPLAQRQKHRILTTRAKARYGGWVAQLAEQRTENPRVGGSIPPPATFSVRSFAACVI